MAKVHFVLDPAFEPAILRSSQMRDLLTDYGDEVAEQMFDSAPFRTGALRRDITVETNYTASALTVRVVSHDFKTLWHEFGTKKMPAHPFMRPALARVIPSARLLSR